MFKPLNSKRFNSPTSVFAPGPAPFLDWIATERLVVDTEYQREIGRRGATNVAQIAEHFDWSKFAPVIVAPVEGGRFAIVDGQHRTTAAILREIKEVPCQVVQADRAQQAAAYAAVNGNVIKQRLNNSITRGSLPMIRTHWKLPRSALRRESKSFVGMLRCPS